jgi:hypothetical protein
MAGGFTSATFIGRAVELGRLDAALERLELAPFSRAELAEHLEAVARAPLPADRLAQRRPGGPCRQGQQRGRRRDQQAARLTGMAVELRTLVEHFHVEAEAVPSSP